MAWIIDADALFKRAEDLEKSARNKLNDDLMDKTDRIRWMAILSERSAFKYDIQEAVTVDAVPVVRCKDCKYWKLSQYNTMGIHICWRFSGVRGEHDFCSRGEREDDDETD